MHERALKIIELLMKDEQGLSGADLSGYIGVSARTIRSDIKGLFPALQRHGALLHANARCGYRLEILDETAFHAYLDSLRAHDDFSLAGAGDRLRLILGKLLYSALQDRQVSQAQLADEMFISLSTLKTLLKEAAKKLEEYHLRITAYKNKGIRVDGDEAQIRYCIAEYIFARKQPDMPYGDVFYQSLFPGLDLNRVGDLILQVVAKREIKLTDTAMKNLLIHTAIAVQRALSSHLMIYTAGQVKHIEKEPAFAVARDLAERIFQDLGIDIAVSEVYYIAQHLIASKKYMDDVSQDTEGRREELIEKILAKIRQASDIDFSADESLVDGLTIHLNVAIVRMKFQMNIRNESLALIKKEYPLAFQFGIIAGSVIEALEQVHVNESEIGYIAIHFGAALNRMGIDCNTDSKKVLIVCANGIGMAILLKTKLKKYFKDRIEVVQTVAGYQLTPEKVDSVDLVLTTIPVAHIKSEKIIAIRRLLDDDEIAIIEQRVFGKIIKQDILPAFFRADCFYAGMRFQNKREALEFITQRAVQKNLMNETTKASVWEREEASSTEIGNLVAIPHPMISDTEVSSISILILKKPILWDEQQVQVVFLLNIAKEQFVLWETVFLKLFDYLVKENGVKLMIQEPSHDKFIRQFMKKF